jgi:hypothetical protein
VETVFGRRRQRPASPWSARSEDGALPLLPLLLLLLLLLPLLPPLLLLLLMLKDLVVAVFPYDPLRAAPLQWRRVGRLVGAAALGPGRVPLPSGVAAAASGAVARLLVSLVV